MEESLPMAINIGLHACQVEALPAHDRHRPPQTRSPRGECRYMRQSGGMLGERKRGTRCILADAWIYDCIDGHTDTSMCTSSFPSLVALGERWIMLQAGEARV